jgi:MarR family 2-MHQ and catechol resistance regulon transcriptional repressor
MPSKYKGNPEEKRALDAYIKLQRAAETVLDHCTAHLAQVQLSTSQFAVLEALHHLGILSQRALGQKLLKSPGNMTIVLRNLEKRGLITRVRSQSDSRYMEVCITDQGRSLLLSIFDQHVAGIVEEMSILTPEEQETLARLCRKLGLRESV